MGLRRKRSRIQLVLRHPTAICAEMAGLLAAGLLVYSGALAVGGNLKSFSQNVHEKIVTAEKGLEALEVLNEVRHDPELTTDGLKHYAHQLRDAGLLPDENSARVQPDGPSEPRHDATHRQN